MNITESCLTYDETIALIKRNWDISVDKYEHVTGSTACCSKIFANDKYYFLKEFQDSFNVHRACREAEVCECLNTNNIPVSEILTTFSGESYALSNNRIFQLQKYVFGMTPVQNSLKIETMCQASSYLGKIQRLLRNFDMPTLFDSAWLDKFNVREYISCYKETLNAVKARHMDEQIKRKIQADLESRIYLTEQMSSFAKYFDDVTYTPSHGDYTPSQLICDGDKIIKIVDFSNTHSVPAVLELVRFYYLASSDLKNTCDFNMTSFKKYISSYLEEFKLTKKDLESVSYIVTYYLGRNRFLYRDFLRTGEVEAFERSSHTADLCFLFYLNAEDISHNICNLL